MFDPRTDIQSGVWWQACNSSAGGCRDSRIAGNSGPAKLVLGW